MLLYGTIMDMDTNQLAEAIGAQLRAERARANLTLREAGDRAGVHYVSISRYEQGKLPTLDALYRLAEAYGIEIGALLPLVKDVSEAKKK